MPEMIIIIGEDRMNKTIDAYKKEIALIRTGRANPTVLNNINVLYYGAMTPLNQIAQISVPEAQLLVIKPFDKYSLKDIEKAIQIADLNLVPQSDGTLIRINFPALTEQRRKELVKETKTAAEVNKVAIRNIRRDLIEQLKKLEKDAKISEDELKKRSEDVQKLTDKYIEKIDLLCKEKEESIMEI